MIRISQLKLKVGHTREELFEEIIHQAHGKRPREADGGVVGKKMFYETWR